MKFSSSLLASLTFGTTLFLVGCGGSTTAPVDSGPAPAPGTVNPDPASRIKAEAPKTEEPKAEAPKAEAPPAEAPKAEAPKADAPKIEAPKTDTPKIEAPKNESAALNGEEKAEIAKLASKEDQALALAQATCLISGEHLGAMGVPIKVSAEGKSAFLCCKGCVKDFEKDPKAALAKLGK